MGSKETPRQPLLSRLLGYLEADPDNGNLRAEVFDTALACGERDVARAQVERALREQPGDAGWTHRQAMLSLAAGQYADAQSALEGLIADGHDAPAIRYNLGYALFSKGDFEAARDTLAPLMNERDDPSSLALAYWLRSEHQLGALEEALAEFRAQASRRPLSAEALGVASLLAVDAVMLEEGRALSEKALQSRGDQLEALAARGTIALAEQDLAVGLPCFERALKVNPGDGRCWSGLGLARMLQSRLPEALVAFQKAVAGIPGHIGTWISLGWCQFLMQQPEAARASFEQALAIDRNFGESHGALAVALAALGQTERARNEIELALRLDRKSLSARYAEAMLSGDVKDPEAFGKLMRRFLGQHRSLRKGDEARTLADDILGRSSGPGQGEPTA